MVTVSRASCTGNWAWDAYRNWRRSSAARGLPRDPVTRRRNTDTWTDVWAVRKSRRRRRRSSRSDGSGRTPRRTPSNAPAARSACTPTTICWTPPPPSSYPTGLPVFVRRPSSSSQQKTRCIERGLDSHPVVIDYGRRCFFLFLQTQREYNLDVVTTQSESQVDTVEWRVSPSAFESDRVVRLGQVFRPCAIDRWVDGEV